MSSEDVAELSLKSKAHSTSSIKQQEHESELHQIEDPESKLIALAHIMK